MRFQSRPWRGAARHGQPEQPDVGLLREEGEGLVREVVRGDDLHEVLEHERGERAVHLAADRDDAAERGQRVAREGAAEGLGDRVADAGAARVVVLDDHGRRPGRRSRGRA